MNPLWSYAFSSNRYYRATWKRLTAIPVMLDNATERPDIGWRFNIAAQVVWVAYAIGTRQWGFLVTAVAYAVVYSRLLHRVTHADRAELSSSNE